jgi:hypothetical protein
VEVVELLQRYGVSVNALTTGGCSALWLLARHCDASDCFDAPRIARFLVKLGANVHFHHAVHGSLLHAVAAGGSVKLLVLLLKSRSQWMMPVLVHV